MGNNYLINKFCQSKSEFDVLNNFLLTNKFVFLDWCKKLLWSVGNEEIFNKHYSCHGSCVADDSIDILQG